MKRTTALCVAVAQETYCVCTPCWVNHIGLKCLWNQLASSHLITGPARQSPIFLWKIVCFLKCHCCKSQTVLGLSCLNAKWARGGGRIPQVGQPWDKATNCCLQIKYRKKRKYTMFRIISVFCAQMIPILYSSSYYSYMVKLKHWGAWLLWQHPWPHCTSWKIWLLVKTLLHWRSKLGTLLLNVALGFKVLQDFKIMTHFSKWLGSK